jgi:hypothetical protein
MTKRNVLTLILLTLFLMGGVIGVQAQTQTAATPQTETRDDETNLDTQLYLIVGTNQDVADSRLPASLDPVVKQMRAALPYRNYRLAATLLNRVKNEGRLDLSWIGGPLASPLGPSTAANTPSFSQFKVRQVKIARSSDGQSMVQMVGFNFGARIQIQASSVAANGQVIPSFNYENTGISTDISMREGEPVIVGTLNAGPSGDAIILVVSAKRTSR